MSKNKWTLTITNTTICKIMCLISLAITTLPVLDYYSPWYITLIPVVVILFPILLKNGKELTKVFIVGVLVLSFLLLRYYFVKRSLGFFSYFTDAFVSFIPCFIAITMKCKIKDKSFFINYLQLAALLLTVTSITTIIGFETYPHAARELAAQALYADRVPIYQRANIGGYQFIYSLVIFLPIMVWLTKHSTGTMKIVNVVELLCFIVCIYESQYTIALIMTVLSILILFAVKSRARLIAVAFVTAVFFMFDGLSVLGNAFAFFSEQVEHAYVSDRLLQVSQLLKGQQVSTDTTNTRINYYLSAFDTFGNNPLFGANILGFHPDTISGHSEILDICAGGGIFALALTVIIIGKLYFQIMGKEKKEFVIYAVWLLATAIASLNTLVFTLPITVMFVCSMCVQRVKALESDAGKAPDVKVQ